MTARSVPNLPSPRRQPPQRAATFRNLEIHNFRPAKLVQNRRTHFASSPRSNSVIDMPRERERPSPRVSRFETAALLIACAVLLAIGIAFAVALIPRGAPDTAADDGPGNPALTYRAEEPVEAWHAGRWYPAHIHSAAAARYFITYDDFSISWHEWVTARRLRPRSR